MTADAERSWPPYVPREAGPEAALSFVLDWLDTHPSHEMIARSALTQIEPLVDWHWSTIAEQLIELMATRPDLRLAVRSSWFDQSVPDEVVESLRRAATSD